MYILTGTRYMYLVRLRICTNRVIPDDDTCKVLTKCESTCKYV